MIVYQMGNCSAKFQRSNDAMCHLQYHVFRFTVHVCFLFIDVGLLMWNDSFIMIRITSKRITASLSIAQLNSTNFP